MKKLFCLLLVLMTLAIPALAETVTPSSYAGFWSAVGMQVAGEIVPPTAFTTLKLKISLFGNDSDFTVSFEAFQDKGEKWLRGEFITWQAETASFTQLQFHNMEQVALEWKLIDKDTLALYCKATSGAFEHTVIFKRSEPWTIANPVGTWENVGYWNLAGSKDFYYAGNQLGSFTLKEDGTFMFNNYGKGTWTQEDGVVYLEFGKGDYFFLWVSGQLTEKPLLELPADEYNTTYVFELQ